MAKKRQPGRGAPPLDAGVAEMRALAHPLRLRIMELFAEAPRTTKQVADLLGQPPTRLYHHVAALERAGLLRLKETRRNRGAVEKWYESIARTMSAARTGPARKSERSTRRALAMTVLEQSRQEVLHAIHAPVAEAPLLARVVFAASAARSAEIRQRLLAFLQQIKGDFADEADATDCERWSMTLTLAPAWPRRD